MSEHIHEWLSAYLDGELKGSRLHQVEAHLAGCEACRAELRSFQNLSTLLHEIPAPEFTSPEKFAAQINLRLPRQAPKPMRHKVQETGWWMIPVGLLTLWILTSTISLVGNLLATTYDFGLLSNAPGWLIPDSGTGALWSGTLGEFGLLRGSSLEWAETLEAFTRSTLPQIIWQVSIAMLYLTWIAIWWTRHTRQEHGQLLKS